MFQVSKALDQSIASRSLRVGLLALALVQIPLVGLFFTSPATALAGNGYGTAYPAAVICDPAGPKQIKMYGNAAAAPEFSRQWIRVRFQIDKLVNGTWYWVPLDGGYSTTPWYSFVHDRRYNTIGISEWVVYNMNGSGGGTYRVKAQYGFLLSGTKDNGIWTAWTNWSVTTSYQILPYSELRKFATCNI
jgi:hypothetical protein